MKKRRKDKYNPYTILKSNEKYIVSFKNNTGIMIKTEVSEEVYNLFDRSELLDISQMHKFERHIEHFELDDVSLFSKSLNKDISVEEQVEKKILIDELKNSIYELPIIQKRRLVKYFFENKTFEQIAEEENCTKMAVKFSVDIAIKNISKKMKN